MSQKGQFEFQKGTTAHIPIETLDVAGGTRVDVDAGVPTINGMWVNGTAVDPTTAIYALAVTQEQDTTPAAITGLYDLAFDTSSFANGALLSFDIEGVITGATVNVIKSAIIVDDPTSRPAIC